MIRAQVCFGVVGGEKKATLKCAFLSNNTIAQELQVFREHAQTAGMSRTDELNGRFPEFVNTSDRPHRQCLTTSSQHLYIQLLHLKDNLGPATKTQRIVRNCLTEAHLCLHAHHTLDLTAARYWNRLECQNGHLRRPLALWRSARY